MSSALPTASPTASTRVSLLGGFAVHEGDEPLALSPNGQRLVAYLALHKRPVRRQQVAGTLWLDSPDDKASASLRSTLWRLPRPAGRPLVEAGPSYVSLREGTGVDLWQAESCVERARRTPGAEGSPDADADRVAEEAEEAERALLDRDLLPDWVEDWVVLERERYRQLRLHALERICRTHREGGRYDVALRAGLAAVAGEPLRESAHRRVIEVHLAEGNPAEALRQYETYRRLVREELGLRPSGEIRRLVAGLLGRPADVTPGGNASW